MSGNLQEVTIEKGYEIAGEMPDADRFDNQWATVFTGVHPTMGSIHVVIPPMASALVLTAKLTDVPIE